MLNSYLPIGLTTSPETVLNNCTLGSETCNYLISLYGIRTSKRCTKKLAAAPVSINDCVLRLLKVTGILIN